MLELLIGGRVWAQEAGLFEALQIAIVVAAVVPPRTITDGALLLLLSLAGGAVAGLGTTWALPVAASIMAVGMMRSITPVPANRQWLEGFAVAAVLALAAFVIRRAFRITGVLEPSFGPGVSALAAGAVAGAVTGLGAMGRLLRPAEPVNAGVGVELGQLAAEVMVTNPEVASLLKRAADAHQQAAEAVDALGDKGDPSTRKATDDLVKRMMGFAKEWQGIEKRSAITQPEALTERKAMLQARLETTEDTIARAELGRAIAAIEGQVEAVREIRRGRERVLARMEHQVATLERLRLAALRHQSADASRLQAELQPVLDELAEAGGDFDLASEALHDADRETIC